MVGFATGHSALPQNLRASSKRTDTDKEKDELFGFMAGKVEIVGDIESPIEDWEHWNPAKNLEK
jgi:hypothetical protein